MHVTTYQPLRPSSLPDAITRIRLALTAAETPSTDLICFPECYLGGYFPNDRDASRRVAVDLTSSAFADLLTRIGRSPTTLIVGTTTCRGDLLFNTALVIRDGRLIGTYAKARPNEAFFEPGTEPCVVEVAGRKVGINICNDGNYPEVARRAADLGADVLVMPLNNFMRRTNAELWRTKTPAILQARARDTKCWVISSDVVGETEERVSTGTSAIIDPSGQLLAHVPENTKGCVSYILRPNSV